MALVLGIVILWRTIAIAVSLPGLMVGIAFIGFGVYRLWLGYTRLKQLRTKR
jgi:prolipoprotein diacylglyceryltransferase